LAPALLPVSGTAVTVREPTGHDEAYLAETPLPPLAALLGLALRVIAAAGGGPVDWPGLPAADLVAAALILRRAWLGDWISTETRCQDPDCRERIDVSFSCGDYLRHHRPRRARGVSEADDAGWFTLDGSAVQFRLPTVADLLGPAGNPGAADSDAGGDATGDASDRLARGCVRPAGSLSRGIARRLDRAFTALAPGLDDLIAGRCPGCGAEVRLRFDPVAYALAELRDAFSGVYLQTHALATAYGWSEDAILALPRGRRRRYAAIIAAERVAS
jgi:hypothetical protein